MTIKDKARLEYLKRKSAERYKKWEYREKMKRRAWPDAAPEADVEKYGEILQDANTGIRHIARMCYRIGYGDAMAAIKTNSIKC